MYFPLFWTNLRSRCEAFVTGTYLHFDQLWSTKGYVRYMARSTTNTAKKWVCELSPSHGARHGRAQVTPRWAYSSTYRVQCATGIWHQQQSTIVHPYGPRAPTILYSTMAYMASISPTAVHPLDRRQKASRGVPGAMWQ